MNISGGYYKRFSPNKAIEIPFEKLLINEGFVVRLEKDTADFYREYRRITSRVGYRNRTHKCSHFYVKTVDDGIAVIRDV